MYFSKKENKYFLKKIKEEQLATSIGKKTFCNTNFTKKVPIFNETILNALSN